jgi:hypothetical protein
MGKEKLREVRGSATIEMAYIAPMTLFIIMSIITIVFYFFDKNIIIGGALETATIGAQLERQEVVEMQLELEDVFSERVENKLIMFRDYEISVEQSSSRVTVKVRSSKGPKEISVVQSANILRPERRIRFQSREWW